MRDKVLIPAFSRALKDPYPRTRIAGLMSLSSTQFYYSKEDCAQKIIPVISPLTIDPEKYFSFFSFFFEFTKILFYNLGK